MIDMVKKYFNIPAILFAIGCVFILYSLWWSKDSYENFVQDPATASSKTTSGILIQYILHFLDKYLGRIGVASLFGSLAILGIITGFNWHEIFNKDKK